MRVRVVAAIGVALLGFTLVGVATAATAQAGGAITGTATDASSEPLAGVVVTARNTLDGTIGGRAVTAADGSYQIAGLVEASYDVCFDAAQATGGSSQTGYLDECWKDQPLDPNGCNCTDTPVDVTDGVTVPAISEQLAAGGAISGTVADGQGHPLGGAVVSVDIGHGSFAEYTRVTTDSAGAYFVDGLFPETAYTVCAKVDQIIGGSSTTGYLDECYGQVPAQFGSIPYGEPQSFAVTSGVTATGKNITAPPAGQITGTITGSDGAGLAGVRISADSDSGDRADAVTDSSGRYTVSYDSESSNGLSSGTRLPIEPFHLYLSAPAGYLSEYYSHRYTFGDETSGDPTSVTPVAGTPVVVDQQLTPAGSISGVVTSKSQPVAGVTVSVRNSVGISVSTTTDSTGAYTVGDVPPDSYTVCFDGSDATGGPSSAGYFPGCYANQSPDAGTPVVIAAGQHRTGVDESLSEAAGISGRVTNVHGTGVMVAVSVSAAGHSSSTVIETDFDGSYAVGQLSPGSYSVCFSPNSSSGPLYIQQCYNDVVRGGTPTPVTTTAGSVRTVNAVLHLPPTDPGAYLPTAPIRVLDTTTGLHGIGRIAGHANVAVQVTGGSIPTGAAAVVLNVVASSATAAGYVTAYADGAMRPTASNLNFAAGQPVAGHVVAPIGPDGKIDLYNGSAAGLDLTADLVGAYLGGAATAAGTFTATAPTRLLDTRSSLGSPAPAGRHAITVVVRGHGGVPISNVSAVLLNLTTTGARAGGYVTAYPSGTTRPATSNVNFAPGQTASNLVVVPVGTDGRVALYNGSAASVQVVADIEGYFRAGAPADSGGYVGLRPSRILDTRASLGGSAPARGGTLTIQVTGRGGIPKVNVSGVVLNLTALGGAAGGQITGYPNTVTRPVEVSNILFKAHQTVARLVMVPLGADGELHLYNGSASSTQLLADVQGYYVNG